MKAVAWLVEAGTGPAPCSLIYRSEAAAGKFAAAYEPGHVPVTPLVDGRIAADLLEALKSSRKVLAAMGWQDHDNWPTFQAICAAIAKAEGAQS